ncbi:MAG: discoidin domain-containing protein [Ignavibacteriae bacterium]|nr:discoidin domain-containing protein [Ignavibacteriota bacterium]
MYTKDVLAKVFLNVLVIYLILSSSNLTAQNSALSVHLSANDEYPGNTIMKTLKIPHKTLYTYYCALSWNTGIEGGGYCGMQNHPSGNNFIFSIWDPISTNQAIKAAYTGNGTQVENFGGEGTGLKSWNFELGWAEGHDYQLLAKCWDVETHTYFGYWVHDISSKNWLHLVTMDFPVKSVRFNSSTNSFLEDWSSTGQNMRKVYQKDGYKKSIENNWFPFNAANFQINTYDIGPGKRSYNYKDNYDAGVENGYYYMQSGGSTAPSFSGTSTTLSSNFPSSPNNLPIEFYITNLTTEEISWTVPQSSTPQFKVTVGIGSNTIIDSIITDKKFVNINAQNGDLVRITIEDVIGNLVTKKMVVGNGDFAPTVPQGLKVDNYESTSFTISWDSVKSSETYIVQLQKNFIWETVDSLASTSYTFSNLEGRTRYRTRVCSKNSFGLSAFSDYVFAITTVNNENIITKENWSIIYFDSEETSGEDGAAANAIDGDENTFWHTEWSGSTPAQPHEIQIDLGNSYNLKGMKYLPRQDGGTNGTIKEYNFYVSKDAVDWIPVISNGSFEPNTELKEVDFSAVEAKYVKLVSTSEINDGPWTSMAELFLVGDLIVNVDESNNSLPNKFELKQAYPNPFNPNTTIEYSIPEKCFVKLTIFNSLGELVKTVINNYKQAGYYKYEFDGSFLSSGVYYYKLETPNFSQTQKLVLLK